MNILEKLNKNYPNSKMTILAAAGDFEGAANEAGSCAVWGIWRELRQAGGLPACEETRSALCAMWKQERIAKFKNKIKRY